MKIKAVIIVILLACGNCLSGAIPLFAQGVSSKKQEVRPETVARNFYTWYLTELGQQANPLEHSTDKLSRFVSVRLIDVLNEAMKESEGLRVDYFLGAQDYDDEWVDHIYVKMQREEGAKVLLDVVLNGKQIPNHRLEVTLVREGRDWKIDKVKGVPQPRPSFLQCQ